MSTEHKIETKYEDQITCPYCGAVDSDSWESNKNGEEYCGTCEKKFHLEIHTFQKYETKGDCRLNGELPHILRPNPIYDPQLICDKCGFEIYRRNLPGGPFPRLKPEEFEMLPPRAEEK